MGNVVKTLFCRKDRRDEWYEFPEKDVNEFLKSMMDEWITEGEKMGLEVVLVLHDAMAEPQICARSGVTAFDEFFSRRRRVIDSQWEYCGDKRLEENYRKKPGSRTGFRRF